MAFNLKLVLKALLFSSSQPLSVRDIQTVFRRYHEQADAPSEEREGGGEEWRDGTGDSTAVSTAAPLAPATEEALNALGLAPLDSDLYAEVPALVTTSQIRETMDQLAAELKAASDIYLLIDGAQGYRLVIHPRFARWIRVQRDEPPPVKLTQSALETMAVVAYRQPVTRSELEAIRGVSAEAGLSKLLERELVYVVGRADLPGRPLQYGTTDKFLEFLGVKSLVELPASDVLSPRQIDEWLNRTASKPPPADAEMGLPLEDGEGELPALESIGRQPSPAQPVVAPELPLADSEPEAQPAA